MKKFLIAAALALTLVAASSGAQPTVAQTARPTLPCASTAPDSTAVEQEVGRLINNYRGSLGLPALTYDAALARAASWKAQDNAATGSIHTDSYGRGPGQLLSECGILWSSYGEILAAGQPSPDAVVQAWRNSPSHDGLMRGTQFTRFGVGLMNGGGFGTYWAVEFTNGSVAPPTPQPTIAPTPAPSPVPDDGLPPIGSIERYWYERGRTAGFNETFNTNFNRFFNLGWCVRDGYIDLGCRGL